MPSSNSKRGAQLDLLQQEISKQNTLNASQFSANINISAIKMQESGVKTVTLSEINNELNALGRLDDTNVSRDLAAASLVDANGQYVLTPKQFQVSAYQDPDNQSGQVVGRRSNNAQLAAAACGESGVLHKSAQQEQTFNTNGI